MELPVGFFFWFSKNDFGFNNSRNRLCIRVQELKKQCSWSETDTNLELKILNRVHGEEKLPFLRFLLLNLVLEFQKRRLVRKTKKVDFVQIFPSLCS